MMLNRNREILALTGGTVVAATVSLVVFDGQSSSLIFVCGVIISQALLLHLLYRRRARSARREEGRRVQTARESAELHLRAIESLAMAIDAKDQTTPGHVRRTMVYAAEVGRLLGVSPEESEALRAGALLHDVGKLAVPEYILNKPGRLTQAEFEKMKTHASVGGDIVRRINFPFPVEKAVRHHHERWDGGGYPAGLRGEQIPLVARIISVVDFYDSTRCDRPYRAGLRRDESLALLRKMSGSSFDPRVVETFVANLESFDSLISARDLGEQVGGEVGDAAESAPRASVPTAYIPADDAAGFRTIADAQREVYALHEVAQAIGSSLNIEDTLALVADKLRNLIPFDDCVIFLVDERAGRARSAHAVGRHAEFFSTRSVPVGEGVTGWVVANARTMRDSSPELDLAGSPDEIAAGVRSVVASPLVREDGAFGAITLYSSTLKEYSGEHARLLESVCRHVEGALGNAVMYEKTKASALTDPLTGLPNARALYATLEQRLAECHRASGQPLSLLVLNLDDFRNVNEQYGHGVGDRLLAGVAELIKKQLRQMDTLARVEADEFVAVMPTAPPEVARNVAERVRAAVESYRFPTRTGRETQARVSAGVSSFQADGETSEELLSAAADDLGRDKRARKIATGALAVVRPVAADAHT